ncbi:MAG TPA: hypothetical protein VF843_01570, partial [Streptosporangiaceae bacterium]
MCNEGYARHQPAPGLADLEPAVPVPLEPVDSVELVSLIDNVTDSFMPDQGPAVRVGLGLAARRPASLMAAAGPRTLWSP